MGFQWHGAPFFCHKFLPCCPCQHDGIKLWELTQITDPLAHGLSGHQPSCPKDINRYQKLTDVVDGGIWSSRLEALHSHCETSNNQHLNRLQTNAHHNYGFFMRIYLVLDHFWGINNSERSMDDANFIHQTILILSISRSIETIF